MKAQPRGHVLPIKAKDIADMRSILAGLAFGLSLLSGLTHAAPVTTSSGWEKEPFSAPRTSYFRYYIYSADLPAEEHENVSGLRFTWFYGKSEDVSGLDLGFGINRSNRFSGLAISGLANYTYLDDSASTEGALDGPMPDTLDTKNNVAKGMQIATFYNEDAYLLGVQVAASVNYVRKNAKGVQVSLLNVIGRKGAGAQIGYTNVANRFSGLQIGGFDIIWDHAAGIQVGGWNDVDGDMDGLQLGLYNNEILLPFPLELEMPESMSKNKAQRGVQIGLVNYGRKVTGAQIGIFNESADMKGIQLGLLNHIKNGFIPYLPFFNARL